MPGQAGPSRRAYSALCGAIGRHGATSASGPGREGLTRLGDGRRVLLAEDNPVNQRVAVLMLERRGFVVTLVANGLAALEAVQRHAFDVILMDVQMPEMDGYLSKPLGAKQLYAEIDRLAPARGADSARAS